jgi:hypothetical protein
MPKEIAGELQYRKAESLIDAYANSVRLNVSLWDFRFNFGLIEEGLQVVEESRVIMSPQHAKMFYRFERNLQLYEEKFGEIKLPSDVMQEDQA